MILDTNAVSAILEGDSAIEHSLSQSERHHLPAIVLGEYRFGLRRSRHRARLAPLLEELEKQSEVLVVDSATACVYAELRDQLRVRGTPIPENDLWIAALALQHNFPVVSQDEHFDRVQGLQRISW